MHINCWSSVYNIDYFILKEFERIYQQFFPFGDPSKFAAFVFKVFDKNAVSVKISSPNICQDIFLRKLRIPIISYPNGIKIAF